MELTRLNRKDGVTLVACALIFLVSLAIGVNGFDKAFPEASIDFQTTRTGSEPIALGALEKLHLNPPADFHHASRFSYSGYAKTCLEKELGLDSAQVFFGNPVELWYWSHRWFKPSTKEEYRVSISPEGEVVSIHHLIDEDAEGATLPRDSAFVLASGFLADSMHVDISELELLEGTQMGRPHRADWYFTWKLKNFEPVEGTDYRYEISLLGDQIGAYDEYLHVPESWTADYRRLRSLNSLAGNVDGIFSLLTIIAIVAVFFVRIKRMDIHWRTAIWFGGIAALLIYLNNLNSLPQSLYFYDTTSSWSGFWIEELGLNLLFAIGTGVSIALLTASAEAIFRNRYKNLPALPTMFTVRAMRTKSAFINITVGITMTAFFFAYQVIFYQISHKLGGWSPADVPYDNLLNTAIPWVAVLFIGFMPAVSEEFMSRMFSIPFLQNLFKNRFTWLAVLIPAFIWGFGHATYPNQPFWIRGVEVGIAGVIVSFVMLRFGILAPLVWHYTVDALYTAFLLFRSDNPYFVVTAAIASGLMVIPLLAALIAYWRKGGFLPEKGTLNADIVLAKAKETVTTSEDTAGEPATPSIPTPAEPTPETPGSLGARGRVLAIVLLVAGVLIAQPERPGDYYTFPVPASQAEALVADSLRATGWANPDTLKVRAFPPMGNAGQTDKTKSSLYLLKQLGSVSAFNARMSQERNPGWTVNMWSPGNRLRYGGFVEANTGRIAYLYTRMPEEMAGDSLEIDSARTLAQQALTKVGVDLTTLTEKSVSENARPHRKDYFFIYEAPEGDPRHIGEAKFRYSSSVTGSFVYASPRPYYDIPESWERDRKATTTTRTIRMILIVAAYALLIGYAITLLILRTRKNLIRWGRAFLLAIIPAVLTLPGLPTLYRHLEYSYFDTVELAWNIFITSGIISMVMGVIMFYLMFAMMIALLESLYHDKLTLMQPALRRKSMLDSLVTLIGGLGAMILVGRLTGWIGVLKPEWIYSLGTGLPNWLGSPWMLGAILRSVLVQTFILGGLAAFIAYLWTGPLRGTFGRIAIVVAAIFLFQSDFAVDPGEWVYNLLRGVLIVLAGWTVLRYLVKGNPIRFLAVTWGIASLAVVQPVLFGLGNTAAAIHGWVFVVLALIALLLWLLGIPQGKRTSA